MLSATQRSINGALEFGGVRECCSGQLGLSVVVSEDMKGRRGAGEANIQSRRVTPQPISNSGAKRGSSDAVGSQRGRTFRLAVDVGASVPKRRTRVGATTLSQGVWLPHAFLHHSNRLPWSLEPFVYFYATGPTPFLRRAPRAGATPNTEQRKQVCLSALFIDSFPRDPHPTTPA